MALYFKYSTIVMQHLIVRSIYSINPNEKYSPPDAALPNHFASSLCRAMHVQTILRQGAAWSIAATIFVVVRLQIAAHPKLLREHPANCSRLKTFWERPLQIELGQNRLVLVHFPCELPSRQMVLACCKPMACYILLLAARGNAKQSRNRLVAHRCKAVVHRLVLQCLHCSAVLFPKQLASACCT